MNPARNLPTQLAKENNSFTLKLNKNLYRGEVVAKALDEDKDWVEQGPESRDYIRVKLNTTDIEDVLNWVNYLIYLNKG